jgi:hypothetical protein
MAQRRRVVTVAEIAAYAEKFGGIRDAWERAVANGFGPVELAEVARLLASIEPAKRRGDHGVWLLVEPRFELRPKEKRELTARLLRDGVPPNRIPAVVCPSRTTLWRIVREVGSGGLTTHSGPSADARLRVSKRPSTSNHPYHHFDASSGAEDDRPLRRLLGDA